MIEGVYTGHVCVFQSIRVSLFFIIEGVYTGHVCVFQSIRVSLFL